MAKVSLYGFAGEIPRIDPKQLGDKFSTDARNVELRKGQIAPARTPLDTGRTVPVTTKSLYLFNPDGNNGDGFLFSWDTEVNVVRGQIASDTMLRTYFTGSGVPKITDLDLATGAGGPYPEAAHDLGLPAPSTPPIATGPTGEPPTGGQRVNTAYIVTFVSARGEEGPPSAASSIVERWDSATVTLTNIPIATGNFVVQSKRIYRAELTGVFQYVGEIPAAQTTFSDTVDSEYLGEACPSVDWIAPDPAMKGLIALPNGVMLGGFGNTVAMSEPYQPHAWPIEYQQALDFDFVAAAVTSTGTVIGTTGKPYLLVGSSPASSVPVPIDEVQACVSARSMVDMGEFVMYASPNGLVAVYGNRAQVLTEPLILPEDWRARFNPSSIHAYRYQERYLGFYDTGSGQGAFTFTPDEGFRFYADYAECGYVDRETGKLLIVKDTGSVQEWDEGAIAPYSWRSKVWPMPVAETFSAAKVEADSYPVTFKYYINGESVPAKVKTVTANKAFRLPTGKRTRSCQFVVEGTGQISNIQLASSMREIT